MHEIFFFGALRVILDAQTGAVLAVQDRISGEAASLRYSATYINQATTQARLAWQSLADA